MILNTCTFPSTPTSLVGSLSSMLPSSPAQPALTAEVASSTDSVHLSILPGKDTIIRSEIKAVSILSGAALGAYAGMATGVLPGVAGAVIGGVVLAEHLADVGNYLGGGVDITGALGQLFGGAVGLVVGGAAGAYVGYAVSSVAAGAAMGVAGAYLGWQSTRNV